MNRKRSHTDKESVLMMESEDYGEAHNAYHRRYARIIETYAFRYSDHVGLTNIITQRCFDKFWDTRDHVKDLKSCLCDLLIHYVRQDQPESVSRKGGVRTKAWIAARKKIGSVRWDLLSIENREQILAFIRKPELLEVIVIE